MNICCLVRITLAHDVKGGMEVHVKTMSEGLVRSGHSVTIISSGHPTGIEYENQNGVDLYYCKDTLSGQYSNAWGMASNTLLSRLHATECFDVIWGEGGGAYYYIRSAKQMLKIPVVTFLQGSFLGDLRTQIAELRCNKNLIALFAKHFPRRVYDYFVKDMTFTRKADAVIAPSKECKRDAELEYGLKKKKISYSINGIDVAKFKPLETRPAKAIEKFEIAKNDFVIFSASRLTREKGLHILIQAFGRILTILPNTKLIIAGIGPSKNFLCQQAEELGIKDKVHFLGHIANEKLVDYYNMCDIFVYPTLRYESFGISVAEAMACGCPVVAAKSGGVSTSIDDKINGFLYKPDRRDQLEKICLHLLANAELRSQISKSARHKAINYLSQERMIKDVLRVFQRVIKKEKTPAYGLISNEKK